MVGIREDPKLYPYILTECCHKLWRIFSLVDILELCTFYRRTFLYIQVQYIYQARFLVVDFKLANAQLEREVHSFTEVQR